MPAARNNVSLNVPSPQAGMIIDNEVKTTQASAKDKAAPSSPSSLPGNQPDPHAPWGPLDSALLLHPHPFILQVSFGTFCVLCMELAAGGALWEKLSRDQI